MVKCFRGLPWSAVNTPSDTLLEKTVFPFPSKYQLKIAFWFGVGLCVYFPRSMLGFLSGLNLCSSCTHCHTLCELICVSVLLCLEDAVPLESPTTSGS